MNLKSLLNRSTQEKELHNLPQAGVTSIIMAHSDSSVRQNLRNISLIIGREYKTRTRTRGYFLGTVALVIMMIIAACIPTVIEYFSSNTQTSLVVINKAGTIGGQAALPYLEKILNVANPTTVSADPANSPANQKPDFKLSEVDAADFTAARNQLEAGKFDMLMVIGRGTTGNLTFEYYTRTSNGMGTLNLSRVQSTASQLNFIDRISRLGISPGQLNTLFEAPQSKTTSLQAEQGGRSQDETMAAYFISMAGIILLFSTIINYGVMVAQGAVEEKSNRIMEIMVNAVTPFQLMIGKIVGIGLAGLTQMGLLVLAGGLAFMAQGPVKEVLLGNQTGGVTLDITGLTLGMLGLVILYFLLGFLLYATFYAAVGSLASRQEEVQSAMAPLTFLLLAGYFVAIFALQVPDAIWVKWLSFVPLFSPMLILTRAGLDRLDWWEIPLSVVIMLVATLVFTWLAGRIYRAGVLMYGQKPGFGKLVKLAFAREFEGAVSEEGRGESNRDKFCSSRRGNTPEGQLPFKP
jgi:ABC-2 type transport system permease protein